MEQLVNAQFERRVMESGRENPFAKAEFRSRIRKTAVFAPFAPSERWTVTYHDPHCSVDCPRTILLDSFGSRFGTDKTASCGLSKTLWAAKTVWGRMRRR